MDERADAGDDEGERPGEPIDEEAPGDVDEGAAVGARHAEPGAALEVERLRPASVQEKAITESTKAAAITPMAMTATLALPRRRPMRPFTTAPRSGSTMMSHR